MVWSGVNNVIDITYVTKWGWPDIFPSSFSRNVKSVASPGRRHSSSFNYGICDIISVYSLHLALLYVTWFTLLTRTDMMPLCFSSTRSQMILLLKYGTASHWGGGGGQMYDNKYMAKHRSLDLITILGFIWVVKNKII